MTHFSEHQRSKADDAGPTAASTPSHPPASDRRLALTRKQWVGLPLIAAVPILTLLGLFGERRGELHTTSASVAVDVVYPERFRYRQVEALDITVRNRTSHVIDTLHVWIDTAYVTRFSTVQIEPEPDIAYDVALTRLRPGEARLVVAELWGERYGRHQGRIVVSTRSDSAVAAISTFVFP
ncbi:MAG TPA: hypothetical protein VGH98_15300 [Gemmatimonadaceae bacterium]